MEEPMDTSTSCCDEFEQPVFSADACAVLNDLRKKSQLVDAVIRAENQNFPIHRPILTACSAYFRTLFTDEAVNTDGKEIFVPGISADAMKIIIDFAYTREVKVTAENVEELLPIADQYHIHGMVKACCEFLATNLTPENCIGIYKFGQNYFCKALETKSYRYLMQMFGDVYLKSNEFIQMGVDEVISIINADELNAKTEEMVFEAIIRWIDYDPNRRKGCIAKLLRSIRLGLLPTEYFVQKVKPHTYVKDSEACKPIIVETLKFLYDLDLIDEKEVDLANPLAKPRVPHEILFVVGGWSGGSPTHIVETYDTRADRWLVLSEALDTGPRAYHGTVALGHSIYIVGGFDGSEYFNTVRCFDPIKKVWAERAPMHSKRCYVSVAVVNGCIYAMGGFNGETRHNSAERYNPVTNQWSRITNMNQKRSDASATSLNGHVYICGGFNGTECLWTGECYNPGTNQWTMLAQMHSRRSGIGIIAYRDNIYAIGGFNGVNRLKTGERYDPKANRWTALPEMYHPRSNFAIEVIDDMLFAIGGFDGTSTIYNVECYDYGTDQWYDATDMNLYRSALSACVISGLPNVRDYCHKHQPPTGNGEDSGGPPSPSTERERAERAAQRPIPNESMDSITFIRSRDV